MNYHENVRRYRKENGQTGFSVPLFLSAILVSFFPSLYLADRITYFNGEGFGSFLGVFLLVFFLLSLFYFSFLNVDSLRIVRKKLAFKKEAYSDEDLSVEWMLAKSFVAPLTVVGLLFLAQIGSIETFGRLLFVLGSSLLFSCISSMLPMLMALVYFDFVRDETEHAVLHSTPATTHPTPTHFAAEWVSLTASLSQLHTNGVLDVEQAHLLTSDLSRLEKTLGLFATLSEENQAKMKQTIEAMFMQINENIQKAVDEADKKTILEIQKQQGLLNK